MELGGETPREERSPSTGLPPLPVPRPGWVVVLGAVMLFSAFNLFLTGLSGLEGPPAPVLGETAGAADYAGPALGGEAAKAALRRALGHAFARVDAFVMRAHAGARVVVAALLLFAVAAIATSDRRGRTYTLVAAWAGIVYHAANAVFFGVVVRQGLLASAPDWFEQTRALYSLADPNRTPDELLGLTVTLLLVVPTGLSLLGIGFSMVLIRFFGGRRGRAFYGVPGPAAPIES